MQYFILFISLILTLPLYSQKTFYSRKTGNNNWGNKKNWTYNPNTNKPANAVPNQNSRVVIRHHIRLNRGKTYTHKASIFIEEGGRFQLNTGTGSANNFQFTGDTISVMGIFDASSDFHLQKTNSKGSSMLIIGPNAKIDVTDDIIVNGYSKLIINNNCTQAFTGDDIYFRGTGGQVCGSGSLIITDDIRVWNDQGKELKDIDEKNAQLATQVCPGFYFYRSSSDCANNKDPFPEVSPLPVEYLAINATQTPTGISLDWITAQEAQNDFFVVERSIDGISFERLGKVYSQGDSQTPQIYQYLDALPLSGEIIYRLRQVDHDGLSSLSPQVSLWVEGTYAEQAPSLSLSPNPGSATKGFTFLQLSGLPQGSQVYVSLLDLQGRTLIPPKAYTLDHRGEITYPLDYISSSGVFLVQVRNEQHTLHKRLVIL